MRVVLACLAVACASLLLQHTPDYDATSWLIWGEQLSQGHLDTLGGPSWKPLPVAFTALYALAGEGPAELLWLATARTGGLLALLAAYRLTTRLAGPRAGLLAALGLALATDFLYQAARGNSEGWLVAFALWAVNLHLRGRHVPALLSGAAAGLVRPEVWPLLAAYGAYLALRRRDRRTVALVALTGVTVLALWFVPERAGSGEWLRGVHRAQHPVSGSPGQSALPFLAVFVNASIALAWPWYAGAARATLDAVRTRRRPVLAVAGASAVLMVLVGLLAEQGFTGNLRYVTLPAALVCVLGGIGLPPLVARARGRRLTVPLTVLGAGAVLFSGALLLRNAAQLAEEQHVYGRELAEVIDHLGGEARIRACGPVGASPFETQALARRLDLRQADVRRGTTQARGTVFARAGTTVARDSRLPVRRRHGDWVIRQACGGVAVGAAAS